MLTKRKNCQEGDAWRERKKMKKKNSNLMFIENSGFDGCAKKENMWELNK